MIGRFRIKASTALFIGGYLWTSAQLVRGLIQVSTSASPVRLFIAVVIVLMVTGAAADSLILNRRTPNRWVIAGYALTPLLAAVLAAPVDSGRLGVWWMGGCLPILATIAARWGLPLALASAAGGAAFTIWQNPAPFSDHVQTTNTITLITQLLLWPCASVVFRRLLVAQNEQSHSLDEAQEAADARRHAHAQSLDDLPARLLAGVGPTLERIIAGEPVTEELRTQCRNLDQQVRDEIRTRRLLGDEGRRQVHELTARGWAVRFEDEAPPVLTAADSLSARQFADLVLQAAGPNSPAPWWCA